MGNLFTSSADNTVHEAAVEFDQSNEMALDKARQIVKKLMDEREQNLKILEQGTGKKQMKESIFPQSERLSLVERRDIKHIDVTKYKHEYAWENVVFEGGGAKGIVYVGALQVFEEVGIKPKRYAGASAGAMVAALAAVGYDSEAIKGVLAQDLEKLLIDHGWGYLSFIPNILNHFGWNPGNKIYEEFGRLLSDPEKTLKPFGPDVTFSELYEMTGGWNGGVELCIVVTNINMMRPEYFHVKTTPRVPIRLAVRMSMSIPGFFAAVPVYRHSGHTESEKQCDYYVDGGVLCNFPLHAYDGWYLSTKREDSFLSKMHNMGELAKLMQNSERFKTRNCKTLGFTVYSAGETDYMKQHLEKRVGLKVKEEDRPKHTAIARIKLKEIKAHGHSQFNRPIILNSMGRFLKALQRVEAENSDGLIKFHELEAVINGAEEADFHPKSESFTTADIQILFGDEPHTAQEIFHFLSSQQLPARKAIRADDLRKFINDAGVNLNEAANGYSRVEVEDFKGFLSTFMNGLLTNTSKMFFEEEDYARTVGINSDYIGTMDFKLDDADIEFAIARGRKATKSFLRHWVYDHFINKNDTGCGCRVADDGDNEEFVHDNDSGESDEE